MSNATRIPDHFSAIVVGSGFGGSVAAYELASAGAAVCVLERGKRYPPGSFPRSPYGMARNFWDPSAGRYGLFDVWSFRFSEALVASGLGGGSLIYANVLLRKPERWFEERQPDGTVQPWPVSRADLEPHYAAVEQVLAGQPFPLDHAPYSSTPKTRAFQAAAQRLGLRWQLPKLAVTFANPGQAPGLGLPLQESYPNLHQQPRSTCRLCAECDIGCNYGSKNTLDYNYLSLAQQRGAVIRDLCEVRAFRPRSAGGFEVEYVRHDPAQWEGRPHRTADLPRNRLTADCLVLAAGTLGTNYLLLANHRAFPRLSPTLGTRYSTNGDLLSFAVRCQDTAARPPTGRVLDASRGTVITSTIAVGDAPDADPENGFFLQDAGYPEFISWLIETADAHGWLERGVRVARRLVRWLQGARRSQIDGLVSDVLGPCELSAGSMPLLGMGRDVADGRLTLQDCQNGPPFLQVDWRATRSGPYFDRLRDVSRQVAEALGGEFRQNPDTQYFGRLITVHPLGGCPLGTSVADGVVDSYGAVFNYPGLYVADGSVMPGPVGSNPSLTIAALARRFAQRMAERLPR